MSTRVLTLANQITILRLVFVPLFAILAVERRYGWALIVLSVSALSDGLDGIVARILHQESPLGIALDPIADKILMTTAYLTLSFRRVLPWWLTIMVISRDVAILATALLISLVSGYRTFRPSFLGKTSTAVQIATLFLACGFAARLPLLTHAWLRGSIYLTAGLTAVSGIHYLVVSRQRRGQSSTGGASTNAPIHPIDQADSSRSSLSPGKSTSRGSRS